jgi:hypothetical protein
MLEFLPVEESHGVYAVSINSLLQYGMSLKQAGLIPV